MIAEAVFGVELAVDLGDWFCPVDVALGNSPLWLGCLLFFSPRAVAVRFTVGRWLCFAVIARPALERARERQSCLSAST